MRDALHALTETGAYEAVAVADPSGATLVEARQETGLACHQQAWTFLQRGEYDTILIGHANSANAVRVAAERGAQVIAVADGCAAPTLSALASGTDNAGALTRARAVFLLQPMLQEACFLQLMQLTTGPASPPRHLSLTVEAATDPLRLVTVAMAQYAALSTSSPVAVAVEEWDTPARALHITIDSAESHARVHVRHAPRPFARIVGDSEALAFEWRSSPEGALLAWTAADGSHSAYEPAPTDPWRAEAHRIVTQTGDDHVHAARLASLLDAFDRAMVTGEPQRAECCTHPGQPTPRVRERPSHLRLVVPDVEAHRRSPAHA